MKTDSTDAPLCQLDPQPTSDVVEFPRSGRADTVPVPSLVDSDDDLEEFDEDDFDDDFDDDFEEEWDEEDDAGHFPDDEEEEDGDEGEEGEAWLNPNDDELAVDDAEE